MLLSLGCFTVNALLIRYCTTVRHIDPWLTMCFRFAFGFVMTLAIFAPSKSMKVRGLFMSWLLASRGILGALGTAAYYFSIGHLGAGRATLIGNTWSVWAALMAVVALGEHLKLAKALGVAIAIFGLGLLTDISPAALAQDGKWEAISLGGAIAAAMVIVVIRQLTRTETSATIFASQCVYGILFALPFVVSGHHELSGKDYLYLCTAASCAAMGQLAMTEGFRFLTVAVGGAFQLILPLLISLGGVLFFDEHFSSIQTVGGALILAGSFQTVVGMRWRRARR